MLDILLSFVIYLDTSDTDRFVVYVLISLDHWYVEFLYFMFQTLFLSLCPKIDTDRFARMIFISHFRSRIKKIGQIVIYFKI